MSDISPSPQPFAERLSDALQEAIKVVVGTYRKPPRRLKSLLNGTATVNAPRYDVRVRNG